MLGDTAHRATNCPRNWRARNEAGHSKPKNRIRFDKCRYQASLLIESAFNRLEGLQDQRNFLDKVAPNYLAW